MGDRTTKNDLHYLIGWMRDAGAELDGKLTLRISYKSFEIHRVGGRFSGCVAHGTTKAECFTEGRNWLRGWEAAREVAKENANG